MIKGPIVALIFFATLAGMLALDRHYGVFAVGPFGNGAASALQLFLMVGTVIYPLWLIGLVGALATQSLQRRAGNWPQVEGRIVAFESDVTLGRPAHFWASCSYDYVVAGLKYSGTIHTAFSGGLLNQGDDADAYKASHPVGGMLSVRYNPARPSTSIVLEETQRLGLGILWLVFLPLVPMVMLVPGFPDWMRR